MDTLSPKLVRRIFIASTVMMIISVTLSLFSVATVLSAPRFAAGDVPKTVGFEGYLADGSGPLSGPKTLTFYIYDVASGGTSLWDEQQTNVQVSNGLYSVVLGSTSALKATDLVAAVGGTPRYIAVKVGTEAEMSPRIQISAVPFALNASTLRGAAGMIALFEGSSCPSGWQTYTPAQGRTVVGAQPGWQTGSSSFVGVTPLGNKEDRTHLHTTPNHQHIIPFSFDGNYTYAAGNPLFGSTGSYTVRDVAASGGNTLTRALAYTAQSGAGNTGTALTSEVIPYVQLLYCQLKP